MSVASLQYLVSDRLIVLNNCFDTIQSLLLCRPHACIFLEKIVHLPALNTLSYQRRLYPLFLTMAATHSLEQALEALPAMLNLVV